MNSSWRNTLILETTIVELIYFGPVSTWLLAGQLEEYVFDWTLSLECLVHSVNIK